MLDYNYFKNYYKIIAIDLSKQEALDADPKEIHQINFSENLAQEADTTMFFIIEEAKKTVLDFSQGTVKVFSFYFLLKYKMTQYNTLNEKLSDSQLNKLKSGVKNDTEVTLKISPNVVGDSYDSYDENNFRHKLLLTNTQISRLLKAFANGSSANITSKTQLHKIRQSGGFLGRLLGPVLKTRLLLMKNVLKPLAKSVLIPLGLTAALSATDAAIRKEMFGSSMTTLIILNEKINDIMKIVKSFEESGLLIKGVSETIENEAREQKGRFFSILLGTLRASLLGTILTGKGTIRAG